MDMATVGDNLYMSDQATSHVIRVDNDLNVLGTFGREGAGPDEFGGWPRMLAADSRYVYAHDARGRRIQVFTHQGQHIRAIKAPEQFLPTSFAVDSNMNVYASARYAGQSKFVLLKIDSTGAVVARFGEFFVTNDTNSQNHWRSQRFVAMTSTQQIVTIGWATPVVEIYSLDGMLIARNDLSKSPFFAPRLSYANKAYAGGERGVAWVVVDVLVVDTKMFVLIVQGAPSQDLRTNTILAIDTATLLIEHGYILSDHEGTPLTWVQSVGLTPSGELLAFSIPDGSLYRYQDAIPGF